MTRPDEKTFPPLAVPVTAADHARGPETAPVTLVEYGDYECPDCFNMWPIVNRLIGEMGDGLRFVYRHFPLSGVHPRAAAAAEAAEAAAAQNKFWAMHDQLFEHQKDIDVDHAKLALRAGLEIYKFEADIASGRFAKKVRADYDGGAKAGVTGTPTLFVNGARYTGERTYEGVRAALERAAG
ncbi:MAG TPA: thioredoxin domain-containing protein [Tepidisphaeraceae bacterium]|nr:thioredoxin domain-containing protein [Tepidisphaeraceae bacterium]